MSISVCDLQYITTKIHTWTYAQEERKGRFISSLTTKPWKVPYLKNILFAVYQF